MSPAASPAPAFTLYDYVLSGNCYKIRLAAALLGVTSAFGSAPLCFMRCTQKPLMALLRPSSHSLRAMSRFT